MRYQPRTAVVIIVTGRRRKVPAPKVLAQLHRFISCCFGSQWAVHFISCSPGKPPRRNRKGEASLRISNSGNAGDCNYRVSREGKPLQNNGVIFRNFLPVLKIHRNALAHGFDHPLKAEDIKWLGIWQLVQEPPQLESEIRAAMNDLPAWDVKIPYYE